MPYRPKPWAQKQRLLVAKIVKLSREQPPLGSKKGAGLMNSIGYSVHKKRVQRVRHREALQLPPRKPPQRRAVLCRAFGQWPTHRNHLCCWDWIAEFIQRGGKLRLFNLIEQYTSQSHCIHPERCLKKADGLRLLNKAIGSPSFWRGRWAPWYAGSCSRSPTP